MNYVYALATIVATVLVACSTSSPGPKSCAQECSATDAPDSDLVCVDLKTDPRNCGECHLVCDLLEECVDGKCGGIECGTSSSCVARPHGCVALIAGRCVETGCQPGWADCNENPKDGCEALCVGMGICCEMSP